MADVPETKLTGEFGAIDIVTFDTEVVGDGIAVLPVGFYVITKIGSGSALQPALEVGYIMLSDGVIIPAIDDNVRKMISIPDCTITSWGFSPTRSTVDVTTLCDKNKIFAPGSVEIPVTLEGIVTTGITDAVGGPMNQFIAVSNDNEGVVTAQPAAPSVVYLKLIMVQEGKVTNYESFFVIPVLFETFPAGVAIDSAQTFSASAKATDSSDPFVETQLATFLTA